MRTNHIPFSERKTVKQISVAQIAGSSAVSAGIGMW
jgi:hypothetical protein